MIQEAFFYYTDWFDFGLDDFIAFIFDDLGR